MESKKITELSNEELTRELIFCNKMKKFWYSRIEEVVQEMERRQDNGNV